MNLPTTLEGWLSHIEKGHTKIIDLGLSRIEQIARDMALIPVRVPAVIVGGTNGKGSCVRALTDIYTMAGYRTGSYFSPHLFRFNERILLNGVPVSDTLLCAAFAVVEEARAKRPLSYFECVTLAALWIFAQAQVEVLILEVGLGGRLDATNIVDADVAVITSIGFDHMEWLGHTLDAIATEKAGIMRPGKALILGQSADLPVIHALAAAQATPVQIAPLSTRKTSLIPQSLGVAEMVVAILQARLPVSEPTIDAAVARSTMPGRFQRVPGPVVHVFDVAHNPQGATWLAARCQEAFPGRRIVALWSSYADKDLAGIIAPMVLVVDQWFVAHSGETRSATSALLADTLHACQQPVQAFDNLQAAYKAAQAAIGPTDVLLVFGGFAIVSVLLPQALSIVTQEIGCDG